MDNQKDKNGFDLSIITISYDINSDLIRCLKSCRFLKISVEHILVFPQKEKQQALLQFGNKYKIYFDQSKGIYNAINLGLKNSKGKKILILHGDNFLTCNGSELIEKNIHHSNIQFSCHYILKDKTKKFLFPKINFINLLLGIYPPHPGLIFQKSNYDDLNYYNENFKICSDFDFYIKIYKSNFIIKYIKEDIICTPLGGVSSSGLKSVFSIIIERWKILSKEFWISTPLLPVTILIGYIIKFVDRKFKFN